MDKMKTKPIYFLLFITIMITACNNKSVSEDVTAANASTAVSEAASTETPAPAAVAPADNALFGYYVGNFNAIEYKENKKPMYSNRINIAIDSLSGDVIYGHSVVAGNDRIFKGTFTKVNEVYQIDAKEPGDNKYDGTFHFTIDPATNIVEGTWTSFSKDLAVTKRAYRLEKKTFTYNPSLDLPENVAWTGVYGTYDEANAQEEMVTEDVLKINASATLLKKEDIENMYKADLEIIRNAIYARHGYSFDNRKMRFVFDNYVDWYIPVSTNILDQLTDIEKKNIALLKRYENHSERYYDAFGR